MVYTALYPIHEYEIPSYLERHVGVQAVNIIKTLELDNKKIVIYEFYADDGKFLGDAELASGFNNRYRFIRTGYSQYQVRNRIMNTNRGKYLLVIGENQENTLQSIQVMVRETAFAREIPKDRYYVMAFPLPPHIKGNFADTILLKNRSGTIVYKNILS